MSISSRTKNSLCTQARGDERVLVTGGTGYLAGWVMAGLLGRGYLVRTTVRDAGKSEQVRAAVGEHALAGDAAPDAPLG